MPREEFNARGGDEAAELARLGAAATGLPPSTAQSVQLLIDGAAKYASLLEAIATAREHIHVEYYICQPDSTGNALLEALVERARAGVRVRLLLDAVRSEEHTSELQSLMRISYAVFCLKKQKRKKSSIHMTAQHKINEITKNK